MMVTQRRDAALPFRNPSALALRYVLFSLPLTWLAIFVFVGLDNDLRHLLVWDDVRLAGWDASYGTFLHEVPFLHLPLALIVFPAVGRLSKFNPVWMGLGITLCEVPTWIVVHGTFPGWPNLSVFFLILGGMQGVLLAWLVQQAARRLQRADYDR